MDEQTDRNRWRLWVLLGGLALAIVPWRLSSRSADLEIRFLRATNGPYGLVGVFQISNRLSEAMFCQGAYVKKEREKDIEPVAWDFTPPNPLAIPPKTVRIFTTVIPTNGGPYRLFMPAFPTRSFDPKYHQTARMRLGRWLVKVAKPGYTKGWWLLGHSLSESDSFDPK